MEARDELPSAVIRVLRRTQSLPDDFPIDADTRLLRAGLGLDSVAVLEFVMGLEDEFGCRIDDDEMSPRWFSSVGAVIGFLERKLAASGA